MLRSTPILIGLGQWDILQANHARFVAEPAFDPRPLVRLFQPDAAGIWLLVALAPDGDQAYGLCDPGTGMPDIGFVSLREFSGRQHDPHLRVERDRTFQPDRPLSAYTAAARRAGRGVL